MKMNKAWHLAHPMPKKPTFEQRLEWHIDHQKNCSCRPIPDKLLELMKNKDKNGGV